MSDATTWVFETAILPGHEDAFHAVAKELIEKTRLEAGALGYEWYLSEDKTTCHVVERYRDSAAALDHLKTLAPFLESWMKTNRPIKLTIYGTPSDEVKSALAALQPVYFSQVGGWRR